ncbi:macrolide-specific efflux system membrane fusion protein [Angulomicrobium tetraedrale]|uniref:Macrolide-specific efflux system membrane fusion protein n=1 Tax=Ancylobacter tetraedralis TaxID=217068 RepID=A0A839Z118_9HYPH|nr:efflux RND transporter periplasmic adaptor subunit [Ancylobacter tetraedralis]MBB3770434.1 macrolide-specific efflux system membrane fusion protein [Ancylobacter tetraedralis]
MTIAFPPSPRQSRARWLVPLLLLLFLAGGGWWSLRSQLFATAAPAYISTPATRGDVEVTVLATGTLKPSKLVAVGAQVSGRITSVKVKLGERVKRGDLIAEIDSITQQNELRTAQAVLAKVRAQLAEKQATLTLNEKTLERQSTLVETNAISRTTFDTATADVAVTRAQIAALQAQISEAEVAVAIAEADLAYTRITAPIDGTVLAIVSQEGQTVNAIQSAPTIVVLGQLDTMTIRAEISEADVVRVHSGQPVYFTILGEPGRRYEAELEFIEPAPESVRSDSSFSSSSSSSLSSSSTSSSSSEAVYYNGIFDVPNADGRLRTYMTAEVHIVLGEARGVLTIPSAALVGTAVDGKAQVRVIGPDGRATPREIETGLDDRITVEVRSGLTEGERVVLQEGSAVSSGFGAGGPPPPMGF